MRVVHVIDSGGFYGAEVMLLNLCMEQKKQGMDVEVISIGSPNQNAKPVEIKLQEANVAVKPWRMRAIPDIRESFKILSYCRETATQIIHSHGYKGNILLGIVPQRLRKIPIVTTMHGYTRQQGFNKLAIYQWLDRHCLKRLNAVVLVSPSMQNQVPAKRLQHKLHIITNGIPALHDVANSAPYESLFLNNDFKMGTLGRLSYEKNFSLLIKAMPYVIKEIPHAKLVIYGEGSERKMLETLIQTLQLEQKISLPGYLHNTQEFFKDINVFINSSITEGMPISLLEAMRQGCHMVATDIPASRYLLEPFAAISQLCQFDPENLAKSIIAFYNTDAEEKEKLSGEYQLTFKQRYTASLMCKKYVDLYTQAIQYAK